MQFATKPRAVRRSNGAVRTNCGRAPTRSTLGKELRNRIPERSADGSPVFLRRCNLTRAQGGMSIVWFEFPQCPTDCPATMPQALDHSIIAELEDAVRNGTSEKRIDTLRQVTNLFLHDAERLSEDQVKVFDDVLCLLVARVESRARAELGTRLALIDHAPFQVIQNLARDDEIAVAGSVLAHYSRLRTSDLVEIASTRGQDHLLAISGRINLPEAVTDVIVDRGERKVIRKLANNASARFSDAGYSGIVARADADDELTEILGLRVDLPLKFLRDLLRRATEAVRARLMA